MSKNLINEGFEFIALIDENIKDNRYVGFFGSNHVYFNENNCGKLKSIYNFLKIGRLKTTHIKVCDPDDRIDFEVLRNHDHDYDENNIYLLMFRTIDKISKQSKTYKPRSFPTASTIMP